MHPHDSLASKGKAMALILSALCGVQPMLGQAKAASSKTSKAPVGKPSGKKDAYEQLIERGYAALGKGNLAQADALARKALENKERYEGHLLAGMIAFRNEDMSASEVELAKALELAPADGKEKVTKAQGILKKRKSFLEHQKAAQEAEKNGLTNKAAREYTAAWEVDSGDEETGLAAAKLWAERSSTPGNAMPILSKLLENPKDFKVAEEARRLMEPLNAKLAPMAAEEMRKGFEQLVHDMYISFDNGVGISHFNKAAVMAPKDPMPRLRLAEAYGYLYYDWKGSTKPEGPERVERHRKTTIENLQAAFRLSGAMQPEEFIKQLSLRPQLMRLMRDPVFMNLFVDAFGPAIAAQAAEMQRARFDKVLGKSRGMVLSFDGYTYRSEYTHISRVSTLELTSEGFQVSSREYDQSSHAYYKNGQRYRDWDDKRETQYFTATVPFETLLSVSLLPPMAVEGVTSNHMNLNCSAPVRNRTVALRDSKREEHEDSTRTIIDLHISSTPNSLLDAFRAAGIDVLDRRN